MKKKKKKENASICFVKAGEYSMSIFPIKYVLKCIVFQTAYSTIQFGFKNI